MIKSIGQLKIDTDEKFKELNRTIRECERLEQDMKHAKERGAFASVNRLEAHLFKARAKKESLRKEYNEAQRAEYGYWTPRGMDCES